MTEKTAKSFKKRDFLVNIEKTIQERWAATGHYESTPDPSREKYFLTFPYPYMNGTLHVGHAFSFSKSEFAARYQRMLGKNVLLPFGCHCTGMPIMASANKLSRELADPSLEQQQHCNLQKMGVEASEIAKFVDARYWLEYFPPLAVQDIKRLGGSVDWRRSFVTTDANPYYDSFIRWQFGHLLDSGYLKFGQRQTIYSILDKQPCADHDRSTGEGAKPQEYTLVKLQIQGGLQQFQGRKAFLVAATLRPETMYGQTNCFLLPEGKYGVFEMNNEELFVCSERSMLNMAHQGLTKQFGEFHKLTEFTGAELLGLPLTAPLAQYSTVYSLPMFTISMKKGTGVVTSVPSDAPDDYAALRDLQNKEALRTKYGITEEMVSFDVVPIIEIPGYGTTAAVKLVEELKVASQNDRAKLNEAKDRVYLKGFNEGVMLVGSQQGLPVKTAKPLVKQELFELDQATPYWEPDSPVVSRSGDECIVALVDQWYLSYGEENWKNRVSAHLMDTLNTYSSVVHREFEDTLEWLREWACSRSFGLGTSLPNDPKYVIESLSDSTIYMAYYTVAHLLQGGSLSGRTMGPAGVSPAQLTTPVWDYIFTLSEDPPASEIPLETLKQLRSEFEYWYPLDVRCSAKDLIRNHLTMSLYNHAAIWEKHSELWPRSFFCNGYVLLNAEKMSKHTGNFLTLAEALESYGADATRISLADAGDSLEDGNFMSSTADTAVLKLHALHEHIAEDLAGLSGFRNTEKTFFDILFENTLNQVIELGKRSYETMQYREVLKNCFYELLNAKELYRILVGDPHSATMRRYIEVQLLLMTPIIPHFCEYQWGLLGQALGWGRASALDAQAFPVPTAPTDYVLLRQFSYIQSVLRTSRVSKEKSKRKDKKTAKKLCVYIALEFSDVHREVLEILFRHYTEHPESQKNEYVSSIKAANPGLIKTKGVMQFAAFMSGEYRTRGLEAFETKLPFDEYSVLEHIRSHLQRELELSELVLLYNTEAFPEDKTQIRFNALPGTPQCFYHDFR